MLRTLNKQKVNNISIEEAQKNLKKLLDSDQYTAIKENGKVKALLISGEFIDLFKQTIKDIDDELEFNFELSSNTKLRNQIKIAEKEIENDETVSLESLFDSEEY